MSIKKILFTTIIFLSFQNLIAQITVVGAGSVTPAQLANTIAGNGVTIQNITGNCPSLNSGLFYGAGPLGIDSGLILSTGHANSVVFGSTLIGSSGPGDAQLGAIALSQGTNSTTFDACVIEFDIIPGCDTMKLNYIFGSDEYNTFVNSQYNDVFAFLVSGPNPSGGNYTNFNIATVPGTTVPVTINSINNGNGNAGPCVNCTYFVNSPAGPLIGYNAHTTVITAKVVTVPNATYHFKLGIADAADGSLDSGVLLQFEGLNCPEDTLILDKHVAYICDGDSVKVTATGSTGYSWTPITDISDTTEAEVWLSPSQTTTYYVSGYGFSGITRYDSVTIYVTPQPTLSPIVSSTQLQNNIICAGDSAVLYLPFNTGGILRWMLSTTAGVYSQIATDTNLIVLHNIQTSTQIVAIQESNCDTLTEAITITVAPLPDFTVSPNDTICEGQSTNITVIGVQGNYTWTPTTGLTFPAAPLTSIVNAAPTQTTFYTVKQTNPFGCSDSTIVTVAVVPYPILNAVPTDGVCGSNNGSIAANVSSGTPPYIYIYNGGIGTIDNVLTGLGPGSYPVEVVDKHGCRVYDTVIVRDYIDIDAQLSWNSQNSFYTPGPPIEGSTPFEISFTNQSTGTITNYVWYFGNGDTLTEIAPFNATTNHVTYNEDGTYSVMFIAYNNNPLCADTFVVDVQAIGTSAINTVPNVITPNGDGFNDQFELELVNIIKINASIFNRWGKEVYTWDALDRPWRGLNIDGAELPPGTYFYTIVGEGIDGKKHEKSGFVQLLR